MKKTKTIMVATILLIFTIVTYAQDEKKKFEPESLMASSGEGPLSNGIFLEAYFSYGNDILNASLGERDMYFIYLKGLGSKFHIGPSFEYYYNLPLLGVMTVITPIQTKSFSLGATTWSGMSAGEFGGKADLGNWKYLFFWQSVDASYKNFTATAAVMNFNGTWGHLVDFKYRQPVTDNWKLFSSAGYSWYEDGKPLLKLGVIYEFK